MDDDGSRTLSEAEFAKACQNFKIGISEDNIPILFNAFDTNRDGTLNIDEFLMAIRGSLSSKRLALVEQAFHKIDRDGSGTLEPADIRDSYNASRHPEVM
jgi:calcyphosin